MRRHALSDAQWADLPWALPERRRGPKSKLGDWQFDAVLFRAKRRPIYVALTPGQRREAVVAEEPIVHARGRALLGDTGYDASSPR